MQHHALAQNNLTQLLSSGAIWFGADLTPLKRIEQHTPHRLSKLPSQTPTATFNIPELDEIFPHRGLPYSTVHEWSVSNSTLELYNMTSPLSILSLLIGNSLRQHYYQSNSQQETNKQNINKHFIPYIVWIGEPYPTPHLLEHTLAPFPWRSHCLFIQPSTPAKRLWSILQCLRSPLVAAVIADGNSLPTIASRRLHLAAREGQALLFLTRNTRELNKAVSAYSRWIVRPTPGETQPTFELTLAYARSTPAPQSWIVNFDEKYTLHLSTKICSRACKQDSSSQADSEQFFARFAATG